MSNVISLFKAAPEGALHSTIWATGQIAGRVCLCDVVREIDAQSFFVDETQQNMEKTYFNALCFLDQLMESL